MRMVRSFGLALVAIGASIAPAAGETIELTTGERIIAPVRERTSSALVIEHPVFGRQELPLALVERIVPDGEREDDGEDAAVAGPAIGPARETGLGVLPNREPAAPQTPPDPKPPPAGPEREPLNAPAPDPIPEYPWKRRIEVGATLNEGTTRDARVYTALRAERQTRENLVRFDGTYRYAESRSDRSENRFTAGGYGEWGRHLPRWNLFGQARLDIDEFQAWDWRVTSSGGLGYRFIQVRDIDDDGVEYDRFILAGRIGGGIRREFGSQNDDLTPEGLGGASFSYRINGSQTLNGETTFFPDLSDPSEFRTVSKLDWLIALPDMSGLSLKLGMLHEYESNTDAGFQRNDFTAYATVVVEF